MLCSLIAWAVIGLLLALPISVLYVYSWEHIAYPGVRTDCKGKVLLGLSIAQLVTVIALTIYANVP